MTAPAACGAAGDRGIAVRPVVAAAREQTHGSAVATHDQPIAVVLDLVHPVGPGRRLGGKGWDAGIDEAVGTDAAGDHGIEIFPHHRPGSRHNDAERGPRPARRQAATSCHRWFDQRWRSFLRYWIALFSRSGSIGFCASSLALTGLAAFWAPPWFGCRFAFVLFV
jgi:hypothetical protein